VSVATKGRRVNLVELAGSTAADAPAPGQPRTGDGSVPWHIVAPNPLNTRAIHAHPDRIAEFTESLRQHGQIEPCTVVSRLAFTAIFPEYSEAVRETEFVQVSGARRRAAVQAGGIATLDIAVRNHLARDRAGFIAATLAENADREDLDPIEEAHQLELLVKETGTGKDAAAQMRKSEGWVSQRLNLLQLTSELQEAVQTGEMPVTAVRELHRATPAEQQAALQAWRRKAADREHQKRQTTEPAPPRRQRGTAAYLRIGKNRAALAASLRAELPTVDDRRALAAEFHALAEDLLRDE
jgi:ParB family chromosome partitioning protein